MYIICFRRALLQTLESKVTPLLSGIIAYADRNANLDLLEKKSPWQQTVWLEMLNEEEVTLFRYRQAIVYKSNSCSKDFYEIFLFCT